MSKNNDEIFNTLETLEEYAHAAPDKVVEVVNAVLNMKQLEPTVQNLKGFGKLYGKSYNDLLVQCAKVLNKIRYLETKKVIKLIENLNAIDDPAIKSEVEDTFKHLAQYDLFALQQIGYRPQKQILNEVERWSNKRMLKNKDLLLIALQELLSPTFEGHSMPDYKTFTFHSGPLNVTDELKDVRKRTIGVLKKMYLLEEDLPFRIKVLQTLQHATQTPINHLYEDDLKEMILENTNELIDFYLEIIPSADNELIQDIEEQKISFVRRFGANPPEKLAQLEEEIRSNAAYNMFRVFVGYDGRLDPDYDFNRDRSTRSQKVDEFVEDISEENLEEWKNKILTVLKNHAVSEPGGYGYFESFLFKIGNQKPDLALKLISSIGSELSPFLLNLISGLWGSKPIIARQLISDWVDAGKYLPSLGFIFVAVEDFDSELFQKILKKAKEAKDVSALNNLFRSALQHYPEQKKLKASILEIIQELNKQKNTRWVDNLWFKSDQILKNLTKKDWDTLLECLLLLPKIDYQAEEILKVLTDKDPGRVISFFHDRVKIKSKKDRSVNDRYDGVPFNFHKLGEALRPHAKTIVPLILKWYDEGGPRHNWLYKWEASHLLEEIFPGLDPIVEDALIKIVGDGTKKSREIIYSVLGKYTGGAFLWSVVKALIEQYAESKEYEEVAGHLFGYLSQTGVVSGEDGFVRAFEAKKKDIQKLKEDPSTHVQQFAKEYEDYLNRRINDEKKRTSEEIELMKRGIR